MEKIELYGDFSGFIYVLAEKVPSSGHSSTPAGYFSPAGIPRKSAGRWPCAAGLLFGQSYCGNTQGWENTPHTGDLHPRASKVTP